MKLKLDSNVSYALALEGGGARGAYQIGAWKALREAGIKISAVSGTSVGAMNGALIAMGDLELAESIWKDVCFSKVMNVDDDSMAKLIRGDLRELDLRSVVKELRGVLKNRGFDVTPLYNWIKEVVSEPAIRQSDMELYIVTYSLTDQKVLELRAKDLPEGDIWDMLLASSYLPVFKNEPLGGKRYTDGGLRDVLPLHVLVENGYRNIIALRLYGIGIERPVHIPRTTRVHTVAPTEDLGGVLDFEPEVCRRNMVLGYCDAQRLLYGLRGEAYYIDARWSEEDAYKFLLDRVGDSQSQSGKPRALRELNESLLPALAKRLNVSGGYMDIALNWLESAALASGVERYKVYTEAELLEKIDAEALSAPLKKLSRRRVNRLRPSELALTAPAPEEGELNVCLINDSFPPVIDGVANVVVNYAQIIQEKYGRCAVATPEYPGVEDNYAFPVVRYPSADATKLVGYRIGNPFSPTTVSKLGGMGFNLIHSHCPATSTMLARTLRDVIQAPVVFTYHTKFDIDIANAIRSQRMQETAIRFLVNNVAACDEVWVVSRGAGENLRSLGYEGDYIVMPNGVDLSRGRASQEETAELSRAWSLPEDRPLYLFIGRMMWYKGLRLILDALARLKESGENFCMAFIGDGHDRPEVEEYAYGLGLSQYCRFVGAVHNRNVIRAWYTRADLLLFPSTFDTNGLVVREAAACGLGSVLVDGSCAAEGVIDGETGILIQKEAESLAEVLRGGAARREEYGRIGQNAMDRLYMSWEESVATACERYHVVLDRWNSGELRRKKAPLDELFDRSAAAAQLIDDLRGQQDVLPLWKNHEKDQPDRYQ